jgi:peptide deformylase
MGIRPIIVLPEPRLRKVEAHVAAIDEELRALEADMLETRKATHGIGIAATQDGV